MIRVLLSHWRAAFEPGRIVGSDLRLGVMISDVVGSGSLDLLEDLLVRSLGSAGAGPGRPPRYVVRRMRRHDHGDARCAVEEHVRSREGRSLGSSRVRRSSARQSTGPWPAREEHRATGGRLV